MPLQEPNHIINELSSLLRIAGHYGEPLGALVPSAHGHQSLEGGILQFEGIKALNIAPSTVILEVQIGVDDPQPARLLDAQKSVDQMCTQERINVRHAELSKTRSVDRPSALVADNDLCNRITKNLNNPGVKLFQLLT